MVIEKGKLSYFPGLQRWRNKGMVSTYKSKRCKSIDIRE